MGTSFESKGASQSGPEAPPARDELGRRVRPPEKNNSLTLPSETVAVKTGNISGLGILLVLAGIALGFIGFSSGFFPLGIAGIVAFVAGASMRETIKAKACPFCRSQVDPLAVVCPKCTRAIA